MNEGEGVACGRGATGYQDVRDKWYVRKAAREKWGLAKGQSEEVRPRWVRQRGEAEG